VWLAVAAVAAMALLLVAVFTDEDEGGTGFEGFIQSGTCEHPTDDLAVDFESDEDADDIEPYDAVGADGNADTIGYYGAPEVPGFGIGLLYTDQPYSMVITGPDSDEPVACGDLLQPDDNDAEEAGVAVAQLLPVGSSDVKGLATLERAKLERELVVAPTRARVLLTTEAVGIPDETAGYDAFVQAGTCADPDDEVLLDLDSDDGDLDVTPFEALPPDSDQPVTVAYYGAAPVPGFGLGAAYVDEEAFSVILTEPGSEDPVACGDVLEPSDEDHTQSGIALVALAPNADDGPSGYAVIDRKGMQRELDITPTLVRVLLFAEPLEGS
jgi:hypothetical protein